MTVKDIVLMVVKDYMNPVSKMTQNTKEEFDEFYAKVTNMEKTVRESGELNLIFFKRIVLALVREAVVPGRNLGYQSSRELLDYEEIKLLMSEFYREIIPSAGKCIPDLRKKYDDIPFAQNLLDAYQFAFSGAAICDSFSQI